LGYQSEYGLEENVVKQLEDRIQILSDIVEIKTVNDN